MSSITSPTLAEADLGNDIVIRLIRGDALSPADSAAALSVIEAAFGRWPSFELPVPAIDHLRWKLAGPYPGDTGYVRLAEKNGRLAGFAHALRQDVIVSGKRRVGLNHCDSSTHPDFQGQGISRARVRFDEDVNHLGDLGLMFTSHPTMLNVNRRDPFSHWFGNRIVVRVRALDARRLAAGRRTRLRTWMRGAIHYVTQIAGDAGDVLSHRRASAIQMREISRFDERIDEFFEEASKPFDFIVARTAQYLNWRYCDPRGGTFTPVLAELDDKILGYVVLKMARGNGFIADLLALPSRRDVAADLVRHAIAMAKRHPAMSLTCWMPLHHPYTGLLRLHGFFDSGRNTGASFASGKAMRRENLSFLNEPSARVHITLGDSDWI